MSGLGFLLLGFVLAVSLATNVLAIFFVRTWVRDFERCKSCAFTVWFGKVMQGRVVSWGEDGRASVSDRQCLGVEPHGPKCEPRLP